MRANTDQQSGNLLFFLRSFSCLASFWVVLTALPSGCAVGVCILHFTDGVFHARGGLGFDYRSHVYYVHIFL